VNLQGKIQLLEEIIAGKVKPEECPIEFRGMSHAALTELRDALVTESREEGPQNSHGKEKAEKERQELVVGGHIQIEMREAMAHHQDFLQNGINGVEELTTFSRMLENDEYWAYLQQKEEERNRVREQHFNGMVGAIETGERSVLDMTPREVELQGEENMFYLQEKEVEVQLRDVPTEKRCEVEKTLREKLEAHSGVQGRGELRDVVADARLFQTDSANLEVHRVANGELLAHVGKRASMEESINEDLLYGDDALGFDDLEAVPGEVKMLAERHSETFKTFSAEAREVEANSEAHDLVKVRKELAERTGSVVEEGKQQSSAMIAQNGEGGRSSQMRSV